MKVAREDNRMPEGLSLNCALVTASLLISINATGCSSECPGPEDLRIRITAPGDSEDEVAWEESIIIPPSFDIVVEYNDADALAGEAIEVYRVRDGARIPVTSTTTRSVEHEGDCAHTDTVYELRGLDNGNHEAVHRRPSGTGSPVDLTDAPIWTSFDGDEALVFTFCAWDNSGMTSPCR